MLDFSPIYLGQIAGHLRSHLRRPLVGHEMLLKYFWSALHLACIACVENNYHPISVLSLVFYATRIPKITITGLIIVLCWHVNNSLGARDAEDLSIAAQTILWVVQKIPRLSWFILCDSKEKNIDRTFPSEDLLTFNSTTKREKKKKDKKTAQLWPIFRPLFFCHSPMESSSPVAGAVNNKASSCTNK